MMERFLSSVERQAYRTALLSVKNTDDALDVVQDTMMKFVSNYQKRAQTEWPPLFWKVLYNVIKDWHRSQSLRNKWFSWLSSEEVEDQLQDKPIDFGPEAQMMADHNHKRLMMQIASLSFAQQQTVLLRHWQGFDTKETAQIMDCSEGTVKTHLSRAMHALQMDE